MKKFLFCGDPHGNLKYMAYVASAAKAAEAEIICAGDWGFIWPGNMQLQALSDVLVAFGVVQRFLDGNHDDHVTLRKLCTNAHDRGATIAPNVIYQPRGSVHEDEDGTRFLFLGGAPSIDRAYRVAGESWWPEETITEEEFARARAVKGPIHVLVTHDAPAFPPGFSSKGSLGYQYQQLRSMEIVDALINQHRPLLHIHGHWHSKYSRMSPYGTLIMGLDRDQPDPSDLANSTLLWSREL